LISQPPPGPFMSSEMPKMLRASRTVSPGPLSIGKSPTPNISSASAASPLPRRCHVAATPPLAARHGSDCQRFRLTGYRNGDTLCGMTLTPTAPPAPPCRCHRCGYEWFARRGRGKPRRCARPTCRSPYWDSRRGETWEAATRGATTAAAGVTDAIDGRTATAAANADSEESQ
jgi:hypothetical protein